MAYVGGGYVDTDYVGTYLDVGAQFGPFLDSAYVSSRYVSGNYTGDYLDIFFDPGGSFVESGLGAFSDTQGFVAGLPFSEQGTAAQSSVTTGWPGFLPDQGGILENDTDADGDPLSYTVLTQPEIGTLTAYAGGAFDWTFPLGSPVGRYSWTYRLFAGGESGNVGRVYMTHGNLFADSGVSGFAGQFNFDFQEQGTAATVFVTGFGGELLLTINDAGTAATTDSQGFAGTISFGFIRRGTSADSAVSGFSGGLLDTFDQAGTAAVSDTQGFAGILDVGVFFNQQGTGAANDAQGFAGDLLSGAFNQQGTAAESTSTGASSNIVFGFFEQGVVAQSTTQGFSVVEITQLDGQFYALVPADRDTFTVPADDAVFQVQNDDFIGVA